MQTNTQSTPYPPAFEAYNAKQQQQHGLDFFSFHSPSDILAPHPDLFESELDSSLAGFDEVQLQLLTVDSTDAYSFLRSDTPTCGPPSTITVSSESAYESLSSHSESFYNYPQSPYSASNYSFPLDLDMDFQRITVDSFSDYAVAQNNTSGVDPTSFGPLPPTPPHSPPAPAQAPAKAYDKSFDTRSSFSDYGSPTRSVSAEFYSSPGYNVNTIVQPTVSPTHISTQLPAVPSIPLGRPVNDGEKGDPRKKYKCPTCSRGFARAFNLKTHMMTHDPNRPKPHVCPHRSCGRSFSRKHDLGRHLISIHREESVYSASSKKSIGVERGVRNWCDDCGKGYVGRQSACDCHDVK